jgi:hypothetical protein
MARYSGEDVVSPGAMEPPPEKIVFVAEGGRRQRAFRVAVRAAAALTGAWLLALVVGSLGLGRLPGLPLPSIGALHEQSDTAAGDSRAKDQGTEPPAQDAPRPALPSAVEDPARVPARAAPAQDPRSKGRDPVSDRVPAGGSVKGPNRSTPSSTIPSPTAQIKSPGRGRTTQSHGRAGSSAPVGATGPDNAHGPMLEPPGLTKPRANPR